MIYLTETKRWNVERQWLSMCIPLRQEAWKHGFVITLWLNKESTAASNAFRVEKVMYFDILATEISNTRTKYLAQWKAILWSLEDFIKYIYILYVWFIYIYVHICITYVIYYICATHFISHIYCMCILYIIYNIYHICEFIYIWRGTSVSNKLEK